ncbi:hypothetical protein LC065_18290 [Halobacillus litoralis]|uniref:hypothetical protein n=1 Tax=Halobacillus litoralis TaxID=45668 RepID=UPI001CFC9EB2|nr:hypothetical protein [Halobacillus litoralis]WLR47438.1 hypothetical protein LC065_18290 [Halobacillus litoralis]
MSFILHTLKNMTLDFISMIKGFAYGFIMVGLFIGLLGGVIYGVLYLRNLFL